MLVDKLTYQLPPAPLLGGAFYRLSAPAPLP